ncbi:MAG: hypothetical protein LRS48_01400 [Desulfurococcales archaeon]|nr:hypothetical protein [Desulfurococcales archaeon]
MAAEEDVLSILSKPSRLELYSSGLSGSAWLLFIGVAVIIGSIIYYNVAPGNPWGVVLGAWGYRWDTWLHRVLRLVRRAEG